MSIHHLQFDTLLRANPGGTDGWRHLIVPFRVDFGAPAPLASRKPQAEAAICASVAVSATAPRGEE